MTSDLLQLADLVVEVVHATLVVQAELGQQVGAQLGLQRLARGLHGVQAGLQALQAPLLQGTRIRTAVKPLISPE